MLRYIKSLPKIKKLYKQLSRFMSNQNMWIVLYALCILTKFVINDPLQSQLFNKNNINIVFQLIFNLILHGAAADLQMLDISVHLIGSMLSNDEMFEFMANYPRLEHTVGKLLPLLLVFNDTASSSLDRSIDSMATHSNGKPSKHCSPCQSTLKLLNILFSSQRLKPVVLRLLREQRYLSVVLKLCLFHSNTDHYSDVTISVQAVKLLTAIIKSKHCTLSGDGDGVGNQEMERNRDHRDRDGRGSGATLDLTPFLLSSSHEVPDRNDRGHDSRLNHNQSQSSNASVSSIQLSGLDRNEQFVVELRSMNFVESACNALFGHTETNGNAIMKQICFSGHIEDYSVLSLSQKHTMYLIECLDLICRDSMAFKRAFAALINLPDISYFLCPTKQQSNAEPNQIFLSLLNLITV